MARTVRPCCASAERDGGLVHEPMINVAFATDRRLDIVQLPAGPWGAILLDVDNGQLKGQHVERSGRASPGL